MKILLVSPQPFFRVRGTPINIRNVLKALSGAGHEVDLICYPFGEDLTLPGLKILRSPRLPGIKDVKVGPSLAKFPLDGMMALQVTARLLFKKYDVVHAVEEAVFFSAPLAGWRRIPTVYDMDSLISDQLAYSGFVKVKFLLRWVEAMETRTLRKSTAVVTVCNALTDAARRLCPTARIVQIEDAPLEKAFVPDEAGAARLRDQYKLGERPCIVYTGNLEAYQGIPLLVEAMAALRERRPDAVAVIVGGEERHRKILEEKAASLDLQDQVYFTGALPMEQMPACMTLADVLISPRVKGENTALKIYGYMQTGKPIVATALPTHTQLLDESTAWLCECDPRSMAEALTSALAEDPDGRGRKAAILIEERYGLDRFFRQFQELYAQLEAS
ncbi:glycosyltransferase family 4 protein [Kiritimatiellaeota bacterium B1221]|nr:glycosyltransferase family 4 protein [Kiritimatiellaeota bacterium B1221]